MTMRGRQIRNRHHRTGIDRCRHLKAVRPGAPLRAVVGPYPQRIRARAGLVGNLRKLRRRHVDFLVVPLHHAIDKEVSASRTGIPERVLSDRVPGRNFRYEQSRRWQALPVHERKVRRDHSQIGCRWIDLQAYQSCQRARQVGSVASLIADSCAAGKIDLCDRQSRDRLVARSDGVAECESIGTGAAGVSRGPAVVEGQRWRPGDRHRLVQIER